MYQLRGGCRCPGDMVVRIYVRYCRAITRSWCFAVCFSAFFALYTNIPSLRLGAAGGGGGVHLSEAVLILRTLLAESLLSFLDKSGTTYRGKIEATLPAG